ncbi:MAG: DNA translocase FtsK [Bacilli bacterium]
MANDKKIPNGNQGNNFLSKDTEMILLGVMLCLVALIGLLNTGPVGHFLFYIFAYAFGVFCFIPFLMLLIYGLYLIVKRRAYIIKINSSLLGCILLLVGLIISSSNSETLVLKNMLSEFKMSSFQITPFAIESLSDTIALGGGFLGYFLAALLNTAITHIGTTIVYLLLILVGASLIIYNPIKSLIDAIKFRAEKKRIAKENNYVAKETKIIKEEAVKPKKETTIIEQNDDSSFIINENNCYNLNPIKREPGVSPTVTAEKAQFKLQEETFSPNEGKNSVSLSDQKDDDFPILAEDIDEDPVLISNAPANVFKEEIREEKSEEKQAEDIMVDDDELEGEHKNNIEDKKVIIDDAFSHSQPIPIIKNSKDMYKEIDDNFIYPSIELLNDYENNDVHVENNNASIVRQEKINAIFKDFQIGAKITGYKIGPSVTRFEVTTDPNVSVNTVSKYIDDVAIRLGGVNARFEKVVSGMNTSGLEIPNKKSTMVSFKECILPYLNNKNNKFKVPLGKNITGDIVAVNITDFPHLLVAGATGSGKSIFIHNLIMSLIMKTKPEDLKILLIDPKHVEMSKYKEMPHLLCPIITDNLKAKIALNKLVNETEERYCLFEQAGVSKISQYNEYAIKHDLKPLPIIVVIIDEYADLVEGYKDISTPVVRLAQKSRAAGIHMVISTQRPSVNVITGVIKANLPSRVALRVAQAVDSLTILGEGGAEKLLGYGDLLVDSPEIEGVGLTRLQCPYVDNGEIRRVVDFLRDNYPTNYDRNFLDLRENENLNNENSFQSRSIDEKYDEVKQYVLTLEEVSCSLIQRKFGFGFLRAARIFDKLKEEGIVIENTTGGNASKCKVNKRKD